MKYKGLIIFLVLLALSSTAIAFDSKTDCPSQLLYATMVAAKINNYQTQATLKDGVYIMCFAPPEGNDNELPDQLVLKDTAPLVISGLELKLSGALGDNKPAIQISGNVTLDNLKLTGQGADIGIEVTGKGVTIQNSTINNFTQGIVIDQGASAVLSKNTFLKDIQNNTEMKIYDAIVQLDETKTSPVGELGVKVDEKDPSKASQIVGQITVPKDATCSGSVEMYLNIVELKKIEHMENGICDAVAPLTKLMETKKPDGTVTHTFAKDSCAFICHDMSEPLNSQVTFLYTDASGASTKFGPVPALKLGDGVSVMGPLYIPSVGDEMGKLDTEDFKPQGLSGPSGCTTNCGSSGGGESPPPTGNNNEQTVGVGGASKGGCGGNISDASNATMFQIVLALLPLFAIPPLAYRRVKK